MILHKKQYGIYIDILDIHICMFVFIYSSPNSKLKSYIENSQKGNTVELIKIIKLYY